MTRRLWSLRPAKRGLGSDGGASGWVANARHPFFPRRALDTQRATKVAHHD